jgi:multiple sugar transport system substrate-binding protein
MTKATGYLNGPDTVAAYEFLLELFKDEHISPFIIGRAGAGPFDGYAANVYANMFEGPWVLPIMKSIAPDKELHYGLIPAGNGGHVSVVGGENIVLFEGSKNKEAAVKFIRFMLSPNVQLTMADAGLITALAPLAKLWGKDPYLGIFMEQLKTARPRLVHPAWARVEDVLTNVGQEILLGVKAPQRALDDAAKQIDQILAEK